MDDLISLLTEDHADANLVGRVWMPGIEDNLAGPCIVSVTEKSVYDLTACLPTMSDLINQDDPLTAFGSIANRKSIASFNEIAANTLASTRDSKFPYFMGLRGIVWVDIGISG